MVTIVAGSKHEHKGLFVSLSCSLGFHFIGFLVALTWVGSGGPPPVSLDEVFTVSLEGGQFLGGIGQITKENSAKNAPKLAGELPKLEKESAPEPLPEQRTKPEPAQQPEPELNKLAKVESPTAIEELENEKLENQKKELQKKLEQEEKIKRELEQRKLLEKKEQQQRELEEKKKLEETKLREEREKANALLKMKQREEEKKKRDRLFRQAINRAGRTEYEGESYDAGGEGFGAARVGGKGMGGGKLGSAEFVAYQNMLTSHIKRGWSWAGSQELLECTISFELMANGDIENAHIAKSSGNAQFDDSALRAVLKSSPAPAPPARFYDQFKVVSIKFDNRG